MERIGAQIDPAGGVNFRVWAPASRTVAVELAGPNGAPAAVPLSRETGGYFSGHAPQAKAGDRYKFKLESGSFPDPASRFQPDGVHGPSQIVDPSGFRWTDSAWRGRPVRELVIYELHLGTFSPTGDWAGAAEKLPLLAEIGITAIEVMPIAAFPGKFGWGYDGVDLFAPCSLYGTPDDAKRFIDRAHALNLMVILDVVYNHLGPDGNYLHAYSEDYFSKLHCSEWGGSPNFDGANCGPVREFILANAYYWIAEYHCDGLRLDATQQIFDDSAAHILSEIAVAVRQAGGGRQTYLVGENETQRASLVRPRAAGGCGLDALWNDDYHHAAHVVATGRREAYYLDYRGSAQEFVSALTRGFLFQGQWCSWQKQRRGTPTTGLLPQNFVVFLENHDQVANSPTGARLHQLTSPGRFRALTAITLLAPSTPLLFQGQEFCSSAPFRYFADHGGKLGEQVRAGRRSFMEQFRTVAAEPLVDSTESPCDPDAFVGCRLDWTEWDKHAPCRRLHRDLLRLRREKLTLQPPAAVEGAVLSEHAFVVRLTFGPEVGGDPTESYLLIANLGTDLFLNPAPEPLLAPPEGRGWKVLWSSESPDYGGSGTAPPETQSNWILPAETVLLLSPHESTDLPAARLTER
jgi:maltooligosyltrehalose trehalohydrolase